jgi:hypothetical protein
MNYKLILLLAFAAVPAYFVNNFFVLYLCLATIILYIRWSDVSRLSETDRLKKEQVNIKLSHALFTEKLTPFMQSTNRQLKTLEKKVASMEKMIIAQSHKKSVNVDVEQLRKKFMSKEQPSIKKQEKNEQL